MLVFATRGITHRDRHLLQDLRILLPHSRDENKMERGENFLVVNEVNLFFLIKYFLSPALKVLFDVD